MKLNKYGIYPILLSLVLVSAMGMRPVLAAGGVEADSLAALDALYAKTPKARELAEQAKGILVFPSISKAGFIVGAQYGNGVLIQYGEAVANYRISAASFGYQAGIQSYAYVMFMMTDEAMRHLSTGKGWEIGSGPSVVFLDAGWGKNTTTTTLSKDVYSFVFGQKGLMAGSGLQGSKISRSR